MLKKFLFVLLCVSFGLTAACSSTESPNSNANVQGNIPPEFSGNTVSPSGNSTPGIPDANIMNANNVPKGATPTPGIPDPKEMGKPLPKGATPTPGIPDPETLKKQSTTIIRDANLVNNPTNVEKSPNANKSSATKPQNERKRPTPPSQ